MQATVVDTAWSRPGSSQSSAGSKEFAARVGVHMNDLNNYAVWLTHDRTAAQDIVQEALLRAWRGLPKLDNQAALKGWLLAIVRRESARHFKKPSPAASRVAVEELGDGRSTYDTSTEAFVVRRALANLPDEYRVPLLMQVVDGYSLAEIAQRLGLSEAGAGTRLFRARQRLRKQLGEHYPG